jgi:NDP-sugar pyrophosphorylase family protein
MGSRTGQGDCMNIIFGMCGEGKRFKDAGYTVPKYLIAINGKPMIHYAVESLQIHGTIYFVVKRQHLEEYPFLEKMLLALGDKVIVCDRPTGGAAETLLLAKDHIENLDAPLLSVNCDQYLEWNPDGFINTLRANPGISYILTFNETDPKCSYVRKNDSDIVVEVREKVVISDEATVGVYHWSSTRNFFQHAEKMIQDGVKENNEFYVAPVYNYTIANGSPVKSYKINNNEFWPIGTPRDLDVFLKKVEVDR